MRSCGPCTPSSRANTPLSHTLPKWTQANKHRHQIYAKLEQTPQDTPTHADAPALIAQTQRPCSTRRHAPAQAAGLRASRRWQSRPQTRGCRPRPTIAGASSAGPWHRFQRHAGLRSPWAWPPPRLLRTPTRIVAAGGPEEHPNGAFLRRLRSHSYDHHPLGRGMETGRRQGCCQTERAASSAPRRAPTIPCAQNEQPLERGRRPVCKAYARPVWRRSRLLHQWQRSGSRCCGSAPADSASFPLSGMQTLGVERISESTVCEHCM